MRTITVSCQPWHKSHAELQRGLSQLNSKLDADKMAKVSPYWPLNIQAWACLSKQQLPGQASAKHTHSTCTPVFGMLKHSYVENVHLAHEAPKSLQSALSAVSKHWKLL